MREEWKEIKGHNDYYVSTDGRIRHGNRILTGCDNGIGYLRVSFTGSKKRHYVHRIVAEAFISNPDNKRCVNHIDNNPKNNNVDNLEWVTHKENSSWMVKQGRNIRTKEWLDNLHKGQRHTYKPVIGRCMKTGDELYFERLNAVKDYGFRPGDVCRCCKGQRNYAGGFEWRYA